MEAIKLYRWATWGLLALNVAILAFFLLAPPPPPGGARPGRAPAALDLNEDQTKQFTDFVKLHSTKMQQINQEQSELLQAYFAPLHEGEVDGLLPPLSAKFAELEQEKVAATYQHFLDVEGILEPAQKDAFPDFVKDALGNIFRKGRKKGPKGEGKPRK